MADSVIQSYSMFDGRSPATGSTINLCTVNSNVWEVICQELFRRLVSECGVNAFPIVEGLDLLEDCAACLRFAIENTPSC